MHTLAIVLLFVGVAIQLIAVLGVCVLRNWLDALHAVSIISYGVLLVAIAIIVDSSFSLLGDKALLTGVLLTVAYPVVVHTTARSLCTRFWGDWRARNQGLSDHER